MLTLDKIYHAAFVLKNISRRTDLIPAPAFSKSGNIFLKTENLQLTGSFKLRGAYYKISNLSEAEKTRGIIACSAGNHAQGVALSSAKNGISCKICMPDTAPISKIEATRSYGAEICLVPGTYDDASDKALELQATEGRTFIHPFDDEDVIAGQGTIGLEILDQLADVDAVIVPVGGGGLISGIAFAIKHLKPECKVYGVQAEGSPGVFQAVKTGKIQRIASAVTFADGIAVKMPSELTYDLITKYVDEIVTVSEDEIAAAILMLMEKQKLVTEGAGAVAVAAAMYDKLDIKDKKAVCVLSGGNIDVNILSRVIAKGLSMSGRKSTIILTLPDKPGQLQIVSEVIGKCGGNILAVHHDRNDISMPLTSCILKVEMETRDELQVQKIKESLADAGFIL